MERILKLYLLLFDIKKDPGESINLIDCKEHAHIALKYAQMMISWRMNNENNTLAQYKTSKKGYVKN